jgi:hypothetical protein
VDPVVAGRPVSEIEPKLDLLRRAMNEFADTLPSHEDALRNYCSAAPDGSRVPSRGCRAGSPRAAASFS